MGPEVVVEQGAGEDRWTRRRRARACAGSGSTESSRAQGGSRAVRGAPCEVPRSCGRAKGEEGDGCDVQGVRRAGGTDKANGTRADDASSLQQAPSEPGMVAPKEGARGRWFVTPHALQRWREHFDRRSEALSALDHLIAECDGAHFVKALDTGPQLWRGSSPRRARFVVSVGSEGSLPVLVTVLSTFDRC